MSEAARRIAEFNQSRASDPSCSAFVSASAGSGKTKLLTDRLLRLMLAGAAPGRIQCLTYTRAGAAEMRVRLAEKLGTWVRAEDAALDQDLTRLGLAPAPDLRHAARSLFAQVLDLPGGMRIETIHAFCTSLLRRFPLEAALPPRFDVLDDGTAAILQSAARDAAIAAAPADAIEAIAPQIPLQEFSGLLKSFRSGPDPALPDAATLIAAQRRALQLADGEDEDHILRVALAALDLGKLRETMRAVAAHVTSSAAERVQAAQDWLAQAPHPQPEAWHGWARYFLRAGGKPRANGLISADGARKFPKAKEILLQEQGKIIHTLARLRSAEVARLSAQLARIALPAMHAYAEAKQAAGRLDYADLIRCARRLLNDPGAAWVMYKLDGGLDHLLLDEVQDTAPDQWIIAGALTAEFHAGEGARSVQPARSVFAVGDHKQSIFGFQGARPDQFDFWRGEMQRRTVAAGEEFRNVALEVSFRSTQPVLDLVDQVFAQPGAAMGVPGEGRLRHIADRAGHAGRVEIWPLAPRAQAAAPAPWTMQSAPDPQGPERTAIALADWIARQIEAGVHLESRGRPLHAGDILVLVRNRGAFDQTLLRELKQRNVRVAGRDRMMLTAQPAVADLLTLCDALLLPDDDLALASVLTSPLGGLSDESLMALALGRRAGLWATLRSRARERPDWQAAHDFIAPLFARADFVTPHALLSEALGRLGGRARLFARLGPQAAEAIDELLNTALSYAGRNTPSLQGFVHWLRQSGAEVKRESGGAARELRIMTIHGAKGLQAPFVILPAMAGLAPAKQRPKLVWASVPSTAHKVPLWAPRKELIDGTVAKTLAGLERAEREEHFRLLYVALTRAEDRLLICGWETKTTLDACWYDVIARAFGTLSDLDSSPLPYWPGTVLSHSSAQTAAPVPDRAAGPAQAAPLPGWAGADRHWQAASPPPEPALPAPLAPSRPEDAALGAVPQAASPLLLRDAAGRRFARGKLLHSLLQHLPALPPAAREHAAQNFLARQLPPDQAEALAAEALDLLGAPALAPLFGPGSRAEVPLTGVIEAPDGTRVVVGGMVDRLVILPDAVLIADYKTNRDPPAAADAIPALYRRQMASYRAVLRRIFPDRPIRCALIWTRTGRVDWLAEDADAMIASEA